MRTARRRTRLRSRSISKPLRGASRRVLSLGVLGVLVSGVLLAWAIPALAHSGGGRASHARPAAPAGAVASASTSDGAARTVASSTRTTTSPAGAKPRAPVRPVKLIGTWSAPFRVSAPVASDLIPPVLGLAPGGAFVVGAGTTNEDATNQAHAAISTGTGLDATAPTHYLSGVQQTLAAAYLNGRLVLLTGTSPPADACCSTASTAHGSGLTGSQQLAGNLEGTSTGALVPVRGGLLAAVDNQAGITVARSDGAATFSAGDQLVPSDPTPPLMAVGSLSDGGAIVAWTAPSTGAQTVTGTTTTPGSTSTTASGYDQPENQLIRFATAGESGLPGSVRLAVTVPAGREIDALAVAPHRRGATLAWTESWYAGSAYRSAVFWTDLGTGSQLKPTELSSARTAAVGVSLAASTGGRQVVSWQACAIGAGTCRTAAALRPYGDRWGPVRSLGSVDPTSFPVATESARGQALVGWVANGLVRAASADPAATVFHPAVAVARADGDANLTLGFGTAERAVAVWVQGSVDQKLVGARFTP
jgi:hypothetical protein